MGLWTPFRLPRQASTTNHNNSNSLLVRIVACTAAVALIACAAAQNTSYGWQLGISRSELAAFIMAGGALAAAVMAPICLMVAFSGRGAMVRLAALFLGLWCLAYGITASLGFVSSSREAMTAERSAAVDARAQAKARHGAATAELQQLSAGKASSWKSKRSAELQAIMAETAKAMKAEKAVAAVDPQAHAISHYLAAAGFTATPESVSTWTTAFTTAFYEVAGAFALVVARASGNGVRMREAPSPAPELPKPADAPVRASGAAAKASREDDDRNDPPKPPKPRGKAGRPATVIPADALDRLRKAGGKANGSIRGVGKVLGARSKTTAHRLLHSLSAAGLVKLSTSPAGVSVAVA